MEAVRLDPEQVPERAELLIAADFGEDADGRPLYEYLGADDPDGPGQRIKVGALRTRNLRTTAAVDIPSATAYGAALGRDRETAPRLEIGTPILVRTDLDIDTRGWRLYRISPRGRAVYERWIDHGPSGQLTLTELQAASTADPEHALAELAASGATESDAIREWIDQRQTQHIPARPTGRAARRRWRRAIARRKAERRTP